MALLKVDRSFLDELELEGTWRVVAAVVGLGQALGLAAVAEGVGSDPALTTRVLQVANSAYYGLSGRIRPTSFAAIVVGSQTVWSLAAFCAGVLNDPRYGARCRLGSSSPSTATGSVSRRLRLAWKPSGSVRRSCRHCVTRSGGAATSSPPSCPPEPGIRPPYPGRTVMPLPLVFDAPKKDMLPQHLADLADLDAPARRAALVAVGEKAFRAEQLSRHYFAGHTRDQMTDVSADVRGKSDQLMPELFTQLRVVDCNEGATKKTLKRAHDGTLVESVLMRAPGRTTVCVSSQAGCGMACPFCASGQGVVTCNLSTAEITDQVVPAGEKVTNVVFMGMGVTQRAVFTTHPAPVLTRRFRRPCTRCSVERAVAGQSSRATASPKGSQLLTCSFPVRGLVRGLVRGVRDGVVGRAMGRGSGARLGRHGGMPAGVGCSGGGRARRCCFMTRRVC